MTWTFVITTVSFFKFPSLCNFSAIRANHLSQENIVTLFIYNNQNDQHLIQVAIPISAFSSKSSFANSSGLVEPQFFINIKTIWRCFPISTNFLQFTEKIVVPLRKRAVSTINYNFKLLRFLSFGKEFFKFNITTSASSSLFTRLNRSVS